MFVSGGKRRHRGGSWSRRRAALCIADEVQTGLGLMLGIELVRDRQTREPATTENFEVLELARDRRLLLGIGGLVGNVIRIKPPMCVTRDDADFIADSLKEVLSLPEVESPPFRQASLDHEPTF
jgi:4-aminobutyrate aminotransferase-like enzyme